MEVQEVILQGISRDEAALAIAQKVSKKSPQGGSICFLSHQWTGCTDRNQWLDGNCPLEQLLSRLFYIPNLSCGNNAGFLWYVCGLLFDGWMDGWMDVCQVFKRLYENTTSDVHVSVHLAILESIRDVCKRVVKELTSWVRDQLLLLVFRVKLESSQYATTQFFLWFCEGNPRVSIVVQQQ